MSPILYEKTYHQTTSLRTSTLEMNFTIVTPSTTISEVTRVASKWTHHLWSWDHQMTVRWWHYNLYQRVSSDIYLWAHEKLTFWTDNGADSLGHNVNLLTNNTPTLIQQLPAFENLISLLVPRSHENKVNLSILSGLRRVVMMFVGRWGGPGATNFHSIYWVISDWYSHGQPKTA